MQKIDWTRLQAMLLKKAECSMKTETIIDPKELFSLDSVSFYANL